MNDEFRALLRTLFARSTGSRVCRLILSRDLQELYERTMPGDWELIREPCPETQPEQPGQD